MKRHVTTKEEEAYRLCHHEFAGKTAAQAAKIMGVTERQLYKLLAKLKKKSPSLFPVLSPDQAKAWHLWLNEGFSCSEIADIMDTTKNAIKKMLQRVKKKKGYNHRILKRAKERLSLDQGINETEIKHRF